MWSASLSAWAGLLGLISYALFFLAIFAIRLRKEYQGENLSEAARRSAPPRPQTAPATLPAESLTQPSARPSLSLPPTVAACLQKELIYLRRSGSQLYGLITPLFLIFILARRNGIFSNSGMLLPYAVSYVLLGLLANLYNVLGTDGAGFNFYLLAPVRLRDVFLAKNLVTGCVIVLELVLTCAAVSLINGGLPPLALLAATLSWAVFAVLANTTVGNLRSIFAPRRFEIGKTRRPPTAKGSGLISLAVFALTLAVGAPAIYFSRRFSMLWLATPIFLALAAAALVGYLILLSRIDEIALNRREELADALTRS